ncbi:MAG: hypothetical protein ACQEVA_09680 [Myxococcota bacterium]
MTSYQEADGATDGELKGFARYTSCLIPIIAALVLLALGITAINHFVDGDKAPNENANANAESRSQISSAPEEAAEPKPESAPDSKPSYSTEGILAVVSGLGWTQFGELAHYELGGRQRQTRKFRKDGAQLSVTVHSFKSAPIARREAGTLGAESRRVRFGHKIVVLEALNDAAEPELPDIIERLEKYRKMVRD